MEFEPLNLHTKRAVITGGGSGIGKASAEIFLKLGAQVAIVDIRNAIKTARKFKPLGLVKGFCADISNEKQVARVFGEMVVFFGAAPDTLVNNAGITQINTPTSEMGLALWQNTLDIDLNGAFLMTKHFLLHYKQAELTRGSITTITSLQAHVATDGYSAYDAAKSGLEGFTRSLVVPCGLMGIRSNAIAPGAIDPTGISQMTEGQRGIVAAKTPSGRVGHVYDVALAAAFLASDWASFITGVSLPVNGGAHIVSPFLNR